MVKLKTKTINALLWSSIERFSVQGIQFFLGIVLARILFPADYGLIGMIAIFISISQSLVDSGFSQALIQKKDACERDFNTVFYFNIIVATIVYGVLYLIAKPIAVFYGEPLLELLVKMVSLNIVFSSFSVVHLAKLSRDLNFKLQTKISLISIIVSGACAIYFAHQGFGVWALVAQGLFKNGINSLLLFVFSNWKPKLMFSLKSLRSLFAFGSKLLLSGLLNAVYNNIYYLVIGRFYTASDLGFYTKANQLQLLPSETITVIIQRVSFPVLSSIQEDKTSLEIYYKRFVRMSAFIIFPIMIGLAVTAPTLIEVIFSSKWSKAAPYFQLLCFVGLLYPIHALNLNILKVLGRSDLFLKLEIFKKVLISIVLIVTLPYGIKTLIYGQIICSIFFLYVNTIYSNRYINYSLFNQLADIAPALFISIVMAFFMWLSSQLLWSNFLKLLLVFSVGIISYATLSFLLRINEMKALIKLIL